MIDWLASTLSETTTWLSVWTLVLGVGTASFIAPTLTAANGERRYYVVLAAISGIATLAYATMALGVGWYAVDDRVVFLPRYIDWLLTTPLLLLILGWLAALPRRSLLIVLTANTMMLVFGLVAAILETSLRYAFFGAGVLAFLPVLYYLFGPMTDRAVDRSAAKLFYGLRNLTAALWVVYPLAWLLGPMGLGLLSLTVDVIVTGYLDVISKVGFGLFVLSNARLLADRYTTSTPSPTAAPTD